MNTKHKLPDNWGTSKWDKIDRSAQARLAAEQHTALCAVLKKPRNASRVADIERLTSELIPVLRTLERSLWHYHVGQSAPSMALIGLESLLGWIERIADDGTTLGGAQ
jgi:hypothetical protein